MIYVKWFRYVFYCGLIFFGLGVAYYLHLALRGIPFNLAGAIINLFPSILLIFIGFKGPGLFDTSIQFPEPVFCPHCNNLTDQTPCSHCGKNVLQPPEEINGEKGEKKQDKNQYRFLRIVRSRGKYFIYILIIIAILIFLWLRYKL